MHHRRRFAPTKKKIIAGLLAIALVMLLLPRRWTGGLVSLVQVLVPFQDAAAAGTGAISDALAREERPVPAQQFEHIARENEALQHEVAALAMRVAELEDDNQTLSGIRLYETEGSRIGARGVLIPAKIVTADLMPWRASQLISAGTLQGVRSGSPVVTDYFDVVLDQSDAVKSGMAVLRREVLIGFVGEQTGTHTSRVVLLSDATMQQKVRIGRQEDVGFTITQGFYWLKGSGDGQMEIRDVERRETEEGHVAVGDAVLYAPGPLAGLPVAMRIGEIVEVLADRNNPLLVILHVVPAYSVDEVHRVYVYDSADPDARN